MNMKDKLVKTGRKGIFYKARRLFVGSLLLATLLVGVTVTTYMSIANNVKAEQESSEVENSDNIDSVSSDDDLLLYF